MCISNIIKSGVPWYELITIVASMFKTEIGVAVSQNLLLDIHRREEQFWNFQHLQFGAWLIMKSMYILNIIHAKTFFITVSTVMCPFRVDIDINMCNCFKRLIHCSSYIWIVVIWLHWYHALIKPDWKSSGIFLVYNIGVEIVHK